ncbi:MAG: hypothetical protein EXR72_11410 [Myxococcales bacterium]|nr:hypothetical protein [Myxococcales bacterium]
MNQTQNRGIALVLALGALLLGAGVARGDKEFDDPDTMSARRHFQQGIEHYNQLEFAAALKEFQAARLIKGLPAFDYNIGRCLDRMERYEEAVSAYERYVALAPQAPDAAEIRERIRTLKDRRAAIASEQAAPIPQAPPSSAAPPPSTAPPERPPLAPALPAVAPPPAASAPAAPPPAASSRAGSDRPSLRRPLALGLLIAGGVVALGGGALLVAASAGAGGVNTAPTLGERNDRIGALDGTTAAGFVLLGIGVAAAVAGAVVFLLPRPSGTRAALWLSPSPSGVIAGGGF